MPSTSPIDKLPLRVLIIDDSKDDTFFLIGDLVRQGYAPYSKQVASPVALEGALRSEAWDIALCDYRMPGWSGSAALDLVRQLSPKLPFIFLSGTLPPDSLDLIQKADAFVSKDRPGDLVQALNQCLPGRGPRSA